MVAILQTFSITFYWKNDFYIFIKISQLLVPKKMSLSLIQVMACHLFGTMPLFICSTADFSQLDPWLQSFAKFASKYETSFLKNEVENVICKMPVLLFRFQCPNLLWRGDTIWRHGTRSTLTQVMACCLMATSHFLHQCWLIICKAQWQTIASNFTKHTSAIIKISLKSTYLKCYSNLPTSELMLYSPSLCFQDKRLMIMMSNCQHTQEHILPRIMEYLEKHGYPEMDKVNQVRHPLLWDNFLIIIFYFQPAAFLCFPLHVLWL